MNEYTKEMLLSDCPYKLGQWIEVIVWTPPCISFSPLKHNVLMQQIEEIFLLQDRMTRNIRYAYRFGDSDRMYFLEPVSDAKIPKMFKVKLKGYDIIH